MRDIFKTLLGLAITAPSGDNCQPWRFVVDESNVELHNDPKADTSYYNYLQRASLMSHGAVLENISIAAPTLGLTPAFQLFPNPNDKNHIATIKFHETTPVDMDLAPHIKSRTSNRKKYSDSQMDDTQAEALMLDHSDLTRVSLFLTYSRECLDGLAEVIGLSDRLVFEHKPLHDFLFEHIRWTDEEATRLKDGLDIKTLELNPLDTLGFKLLKNWTFTSLMNTVGASRVVAGNARKLASSASAIGLVLGPPRPDSLTYLEGGRLLQRVWLQATKLGFAFHPMTGISFLMQRVNEDQADDMAPKHRDLIRGAVQTIAELTAVENSIVLGVFRVGTAVEPAARSLRRGLSDCLT